jgi:hypothetical protein
MKNSILLRPMLLGSVVLITACAAMQRTILLIIILVCAGCTTLRPLAGDPLPQLKVGDRVLIVTQDNLRHRFRVNSIDARVVSGRSQTVPIDQIVSVQKRQFSLVKTLALATVIAGLAGAVIYTAASLAPAAAL